MTERELQALRNRLSRLTRDFLDQRAFLEVSTPLMAPAVIPESHIELFQSRWLHPRGIQRDLYLLPSPEYWMKQLLAQGWGNIYQFSRSFRNHESLGRNHSPEFTMLEWYLTPGNYLDNLTLTEDLFQACGQALERELPPDLAPPFRRMTMEEAWKELAGLDLERCPDLGSLRQEARRKNLDLASAETWEELFHYIFIQKVEPYLPQDRPLALMDYPAQIPTTARVAPDGGHYERWELYLRGVELANCYTEETRLPELWALFNQETENRARSCLTPAPVDQGLPEIFSSMPPCSGVALGFDRLIMALAGENQLQGVILFSFYDNL